MPQATLIADVNHVHPAAHEDARTDSLAARFEQVSHARETCVAVTCKAESITYGELRRQSERIAAALQARGAGSNQLVAIYMNRSIEMVVAMLGVIRAGAAYLPLDPGFPEARVRETLDDAAPIAVLADDVHAEKVAGVDSVIRVSDVLQGAELELREQTASPNDLAYVIYTSGSTGKPKGVMVSHHNVLRLLDQTAQWFHFGERDVWTMFHSFAFDFSVWEMWGALLTGGRLVLVPFTVSRSPDDFYALLADQRVTVLNQTPTAFNLLMQADARAHNSRGLALRYIIFGGEALNLRAVQPWFARHGDDAPQLINMYGITETTVHVTYRRIRADDAARETDSLIGEPIPDLALHLLDDHMQPVANGDEGEICIGGAGVALGYLNRPELTAEKFVANPFGTGRLYRSGDLARRRADGELVYLGRADRQVKISGFRIELGEVEAVLLSCPGITQTCVVANSDAAGAQRLAVYFVASDGFDITKLKSFAEAKLPAHMRPSFYTQLAAIPMNSNGKVDTKALPAPAHNQTGSPESGSSEPGSRIAARAGWSSTEQQVAAAWSRTLGAGHMERNENFFDAGGSSLLLIQLRDDLQHTFSRAIPVTWMFEHTTIAALAAKLEPQRQETASLATATGNERADQQRNSFARMRALRGGAR